MALRVFLFSSDGTATSELCQLLTELGIEAEICSEMLLAVERVTKESFDALIVDWDQKTEAIFLLKSLRDIKASSLTLALALVQNESDIPDALQAGANSAVRKPIDPQQAHDTLSTAKQLIVARKAEQSQKEAPLAEPTAPYVPNETDIYGHDVREEHADAPKAGFLPQIAHRSALEAEQAAAKLEPPQEGPPTPRQHVPDPEVRARALAILGYGPKSVEPPKASTKPAPRIVDFSGSQAATPRDSSGVFSSAREPLPTEHVEEVSAPRRKYGVYAAVAVVLAAVGFYVLVPGKSQVARLKQFALHYVHPEPPADEPTEAVDAHAVKPASPANQPEVIQPDPEITSAEDDAAANVQVIENKPIPPAGAQRPADDNDGQPDLPSGQSPLTAQPGPASQSSQLITAAKPNQPTIQSVSAPAQPSAALAPAAPASASPIQVPAVPASHVPDEGMNANLNGRSGVTIPDSLRTTPAPAPATSLEPPTIPEETSRALVLNRIDPQYPAEALKQHFDGQVVLQVRVGADGSIRDLKLVRGYFVLGRAAFDAVKQWRFRPYGPNGRPIDYQTYVTFNFTYPN